MANDLPECCDIKVQSIVHLVGTGLGRDLASTVQRTQPQQVATERRKRERNRERESERKRQSKVAQLTVISVQLKHLGQRRNTGNRKIG